MDGGWAVSAGMRRSREASTAMRSSSKKAGRFIGGGEKLQVASCKLKASEEARAYSLQPTAKRQGLGRRSEGRPIVSRLGLAFGFERFGGEFAVGFFEKDLDAAFGLFELLLAFARESYAFFEELHGIVERKLGAFEVADDFLETGEGTLEIGLLGWFGLFGGR